MFFRTTILSLIVGKSIEYNYLKLEFTLEVVSVSTLK